MSIEHAGKGMRMSASLGISSAHSIAGSAHFDTDKAVEAKVAEPTQTLCGSMSTVDELALLSNDALRARWRRTFGTPPPRISRDLIVRFLTHRAQERERGGLDAGSARKLKRLAARVLAEECKAQSPPSNAGNNAVAAGLFANGFIGKLPSLDASASGSRASVASRLLVGTRLVREWNGRTHTVEVIAGHKRPAFAHDGTVYGSLSEVARAITGTRWSGPRFFGLVARNKNSVPTRNSSALRVTAGSSVVGNRREMGGCECRR